MLNLKSMSTKSLRAKARRLGWRARYYYNWNRCVGYEGYVVFDAANSAVITDPLDESELREWLTETIRAEDYAD